MYRLTRRAVLPLLVVAFVSAWARSAHAALGADAASIEADAVQLHGVTQRSTGPSYAVVTIAADNGILVREFLDSSGRVFAVNWRGPAVPDLSGLLGSYFNSYTSLLAALPNAGRQRAVRAAAADLVVVSAGHLRAYSGLAYLPQRIPAGVALATLSQANE